MTAHQIPEQPFRLWSPEHQPNTVVADGDTVSFRVTDASGGAYDDVTTGVAPPRGDDHQPYPLVGPVEVAGAEPGDVIELEPLAYEPGSWGWTAFRPGAGLLPDDFSEPRVYRWELSPDRRTADFYDVASIPVRPFLGVMGVTPDVSEPAPVMPPGPFGGNIDCRDLVVGSKLLLPVQVPGALVAFGDPHGAQGDGEVCVSAIELGSMTGEVRIRLHKQRQLRAPVFETPGPLRTGIDEAGYVATMGVAPDLMVASQDAVRSMIDLLGREFSLEPADAYLLCSVVVDLKVTEVVDRPNWVVSAYLPKSVMRTRRR